tara:strand:- start:85 stop:672 length:588 start_codon:yes stop_codon:yes gene_type:complete
VQKLRRRAFAVRLRNPFPSETKTVTAESKDTMAQAFWRFSTGLYAAPGVEAHLLTLQDRDKLDVNLALFCLFAAHVRRPLDYAAVEAMRALAIAWGLGVVAPLRQARRAMKPRASESEVAAGLRNEVKAIELAAEKAMQTALAHLLFAVPVGALDQSPRDLAAAHFFDWFHAEDVEGDGPDVIAAALIDAAFPPA